MLGKSFEAQNTVPLISKYNIIILLNGRRKFCGFISILSFKVFTANKDRDTVVSQANPSQEGALHPGHSMDLA